MKSFDVLNRQTNIHHPYILEASAGTGKTFAIENLVVRLLLEEDPHTGQVLSLEQILAVTFTRAAVRDLKSRIRSNIVKALSHLTRFSQENSDHLSLPDYLLAICQQGASQIKLSKKRLEQALFCFDQAQIFTIHSFCARMLRHHGFEGDLALDAIRSDDSIPRSKLLSIIRDFFRTGLHSDKISPTQLKIVLKEYDNSIEKLEAAIFESITKGIDVDDFFDFSDQYNQFQAVMQALKGRFEAQKILDDFILQAPSYKNLCDRQKNIKPETLEKATRFTQLLDSDECSLEHFKVLLIDGMFFLNALHESQLSARGQNLSDIKLNYPHFNETIRKELAPLVEQASSPVVIFAKIAKGCQQHLKRYLAEEEKLGFDDFLQVMLQAMKNPRFIASIQQKYSVAIIDEFQDTDPVQWKIFRTLFFDGDKGRLYLVGDPKQSIYSFRQADIYTYFSAVNLFSEDHRASLDTNFRSQPFLVDGLNFLFKKASEKCGLMALPRLSTSLSYQEVKAGCKLPDKLFSDALGAVHFACVKVDKIPSLERIEKEYFLPFIAQEIQRLCQKDGYEFHNFAILIADRYQGERVSAFLKKCHIPTQKQRGNGLADSPALTAMHEIIKAVFQPRHESSLRIALGGKIIGWTHAHIRTLDDPALLEKTLLQFYDLQKAMMASGFASFFQNLMQSCWHNDGKTVEERLLLQDDGIEFYSDLQHIADLLMAHCSRTTLTFEKISLFLDDFKTLQIDDDERLKKRGDANKNAVHILTMHSSKGLEFDIVFPLGLIKQSPTPTQLIANPHRDFTCLIAVANKDDEIYQRHCQEYDAEKMRQLYVALTRAKMRLYIPALVLTQAKEIDIGTASPMQLFLDQLQLNTWPDFEGFIDECGMQQGLTCICLNEMAFDLSTHFDDKAQIDLLAPKHIQIPGVQKYMLSFTTISKGSKHASVEIPSAIETPHDFTELNKTAYTLPAGNETGILLHLILQKIPFSYAYQDNPDFADKIRSFLADSPFKHWDEVICKMIYNALNIELSCENGAFKLVDIDPSCIYREMEFLYPIDKNIPVKELNHVSGYLKGVIDLIFEHQGKYYIIDWKSNWLGGHQSEYTASKLDQAMQENDYLLQAEIYKSAIERFLRVIDPRPFDEIFGGVYYLFLRGLEADTQNGIYMIKNSAFAYA